MELFQCSVVRAVAATAGCNVSERVFDDGIDLHIYHFLDGRKKVVDPHEKPAPGRDEITLQVQLKAVTNGWKADGTAIKARMSRKRYDEFRCPNPSVHSIVVIMDMPREQADWSRVTPPYTLMKHCLYWVNLGGSTDSPGHGKVVAVSAPATNVFDDVALCSMMARIRAGGRP